jgi:GNAT superfamily N-acetyltransferase
MELFVQAGLEFPQGIPQTIWMPAYPANLEDALRLLANSPPLTGAVFLLNNQVVNQQTAAAWLPVGDYRAVLADPRISGQDLGRILLQIVALADWARKNGQIFEINAISFIQTQQGTFAIIQAA